MLPFRLVLRPTPPFVALRYPYRDRMRMLDAIGPDLARPVAMYVDENPPEDSALQRLFDGTENVFKLRHYLPIYQAAFAHTERLLEIGVDRGGSLHMWREYMPDATIVGVDINPKAALFDAPERDVHVRIGDQANPSFLGGVLDEFGTFDTVLDDGGHSAKQMIASFQYLFPRIKPGGVYIVEDVCANYWTAYRDQPESFIDFTKFLMDAMNAHYMRLSSVSQIREGHPKRVDAVEVPFAATIVGKIEVFDSVVVVHRNAEPKRLPRAVFH